METASILVVDVTNDPLIEKVAASMGERCRTAASAEEAGELLEKERFDLLISSIKAPDWTGLGLAEMVHRNDPGRRLWSTDASSGRATD